MLGADRSDRAVGGVVIEVSGDEAVVDIGGARVRVYSFERVRVGDYVLVHAGFIIGVVKPRPPDELLRELDK